MSPYNNGNSDFGKGTCELSYLTSNAKFQAFYEVENIWLEIVEVNVAEMTGDRY